MKFLRFFVFVLPLVIPSPSQAQNTSDITNPDTGTFPVIEDKTDDQQLEMQREEENLDRPSNNQQLEMQREEEDLDSFGNDKYNENVDPDTLKEE